MAIYHDLDNTGQEVQQRLDQVPVTQADLAEEVLARQAAVGAVQNNVDAEELRAKAAEKLNADDIDAIEEKIPSGASSSNKMATASDISSEVLARQAAVGAVQNNVDAEELRAKAAEKLNADDIDAIEEKIPSGASSSNKMATASDISSLNSAIEAILLLIPSAATSLNKLADKAFVNSSIATATATFRGTKNLVSDLNLAVDATHEQIAVALSEAVPGADNNDYAFVQVPTSSGTPTEIRVTERYKFDGTAWSYEYDLNNSGFTSDQWAAINSTITSGLVDKLNALPSNADLTAALGILTNGIAAINEKIPTAATSSNKLVDTAAMQSYITQILDGIDATFNVTSTDGHVTIQVTQVNGVVTNVAVTTSDIASAADVAQLFQLYNALSQSEPEIIQPADTWPVANPSTTVIYRVIDRVNTPPQNYSDYMFSASDLTTPVLMATYNNAIDPRPKKGSQNLVTSGGVFDNMGALDVSELNATENPHTPAIYADLSAALAAITSDYQKGGMSIKFVQGSVQSNDNKYVQYFLTKDEWSANVNDWEKVNLEEKVERIDDEIIVGNAIVMPLISTRDLRPMSDGYVHTNGEYSYIVKVKEGDELTIHFTIVSGTYIRFGFTSVYPANGVAVTGYGDSGPQFHSMQRTAPFDGYLLMECASDFTELSVSKDNNGTIGRDVYENNKEISNIKDIVDKQEIITTDTRSAHYIKYSDSTLYEGSVFSVTEPIEVHKGDRIVVIEEAVNSSIAVISTCDSSLSNISAKVPSNAEHLNEPYTYEYLVEQDGYVSITFYTRYGTTIKIINNIKDKINIIQEEVDSFANQFADKNFGVDGDSITAGNQWSKIVADNLHLNNHHNVGVGGATWACNVVTYDGVDYTPQEYDDPNFAGIGIEAITDPTTAQQAANNCAKVHVQKFIAEVTAGTYPAPDIFCFSFGTNDFVPTQEQVNAAMAATDYPTGDALFNMAGAMRWCLQKIRETYPECTIFVLLPIQRSWQKYTYNDGKSAKVNMIQKSDYIKEIAQDFGVQVIDMFHNCGINGCLEKDAPTYGPYLRDGLHPNDDGRKNMGNYATSIIKAFYFKQL